MHNVTIFRAAEFRRHFLDARQTQKLSILDVGAYDVNGSLRPIFQTEHWTYTGLDVSPGPNVDLVPKDPYQWTEIADASYDAVVSASCFEHCEFFWLTIREIARVLKPCGLLWLAAPSGGYEHRHPVDCYRFQPDGFRALAKWAGLSVRIVEHDYNLAPWQDISMVAVKPWSAER